MTDTKPDLIFGKFEITVGGVPVSYTDGDILDQVNIPYWAHVLAEAEAEQLRVDTEYRAWRAMTTVHVLKKDQKLSEWKVRTQIEDDPAFRQYKEGAAVALRNVVLARGILEACKAKALTPKTNPCS